MTYNIMMKYGTGKDLWQYYKTIPTDGSTTTTSIYETDDLDELETTLLDLYKTYPTDSIKVVNDVTATLDITFS